MPNTSSAVVLVFLAAAVPLAAQDRAPDAATAPRAPDRTVPRLGARPAEPKHALWVRTGAMLSGTGLQGPGGEYELERRVSPHFTLATRVQRWGAEGTYASRILREQVREAGPVDFRRSYLTTDLRARYYFGGRAMRGWYAAAGGGYARAGESYRDWVSSAYSVRHGGMLSGELGYTRLFGDGTHNRLGLTLAFGAQRYYFRGRNPISMQSNYGPRLRLGWTF